MHKRFFDKANADNRVYELLRETVKQAREIITEEGDAHIIAADDPANAEIGFMVFDPEGDRTGATHLSLFLAHVKQDLRRDDDTFKDARAKAVAQNCISDGDKRVKTAKAMMDLAESDKDITIDALLHEMGEAIEGPVSKPLSS